MNARSAGKNSIRKRLSAIAGDIRKQPTIAAIVLEGFLTRLGFGMIGFALPLYALSIGMSIAEVGFLYALRSIVTLVIKPVMGEFADRLGRKRILVGAVFLRCLVGFLFIFATLPWQLFVIRGLHGAMTAARDPSAMALIAEHGNSNRMASTYALYVTGRDLGRSLGYGLSGLLIVVLSYQWVFFIAFLMSCAALFTVIRYVREQRDDIEAVDATESLPSGEGVDNESLPVKKYVGYAGFGMAVAMTSEMMRGLFPVIAMQYANLTIAEAGLIASSASIVILFAGPIFGWLSDNGNRTLVLSIRTIANGCSSLLYICIPNFPGFFAGRLLDDTGKAAFRPAWGAVLAELTAGEKSKRARTMAIMDTSVTMGEIVGPILAGVLIGGYGVPAMLMVRIGFALLTEIQAFAIFRK
jgi:MFS family permease